MWWAIFNCAKIAVISIILSIVLISNVDAWSPDVAPIFNTSSVKINYSEPCPGNYGNIPITGEQPAFGCIMGEGTRVASYFRPEGGAAYAVSFPLENTFYTLDICQNRLGCVYSEAGDTLIGYTGIYKNFAANLSQTIQNGKIQYGPGESSAILPVTNFAGKSFTPQSFGVSQNGKWGLLELRDYGIFRVNIDTSEVRRVVSPGFSYGNGYSPSVEMAISNDGHTIAVAGYRLGGIWVVSVDETCGDIPRESMQVYYTGAETICRYIPLQIDDYIPNFLYAFRPVFSKENATLSFDIFSNTVEPRHITLFSDNTERDERFYIALGDSFTSGEGEVDDSFYRTDDPAKCHVSIRSYPFMLGAAWRVSTSSTACSGATIQSARGKILHSLQPDQITKLESNPAQVATIGIGGNDAGLIGKLKDCLGLDTCKWASTVEHRYNTSIEIKNLYPRLREFYVDVKTRTLGAVIVVGYPRIITAQSSCESAISLLLNETERIFMNEAIHYLNQVIKAAANASGVEYADVEEVFSGDELCSSLDSPLMNAIRIGDDYPNIPSLPFVKIIGAESFHPKPAGHAKVAEKIFQDFPNPSGLVSSTNNSNSTDIPVPSVYWNSGVNSLKQQKAVSFLNKVTIKVNDMFEISFPAFSFLPGSDVVLELHSDVKNLGVVQSARDGSVSVAVPAAGFEPGFHSVHAIGKSYAGNDIDTYDFIAVEENPSPTSSSSTLIPAISSATGVQPRQTTLPALRDDNSSEVLGASIVTTPNLDIIAIAPTTEKATQEGSKPSKNSTYWLLAVIATIPGLVVLVISLFVYYQQKQARNST